MKVISLFCSSFALILPTVVAAQAGAKLTFTSRPPIIDFAWWANALDLQLPDKRTEILRYRDGEFFILLGFGPDGRFWFSRYAVTDIATEKHGAWEKRFMDAAGKRLPAKDDSDFLVTGVLPPDQAARVGADNWSFAVEKYKLPPDTVAFDFIIRYEPPVVRLQQGSDEKAVSWQFRIDAAAKKLVSLQRSVVSPRERGQQ